MSSSTTAREAPLPVCLPACVYAGPTNASGESFTRGQPNELCLATGRVVVASLRPQYVVVVVGSVLEPQFYYLPKSQRHSKLRLKRQEEEEEEESSTMHA